VRVTTAFNRMLLIPGATVTTVEFTPKAIVVGLRARAVRLRCSCGWSTRAVYDRSTRRWRHHDLGLCKLFLTAEIRRLDCRRCDRVVTEVVPWARPGARCTRTVEDVIAFMAQRIDKTTVSTLLRVSWQTVADVVVRVVAEHIDDARFDGLRRIGVDEISYRTDHKFLTVVADHDDAGAVVWAGEGRNAATLARFYEELGPERCKEITAVSLDMGASFAKATRTHAPDAEQCVDPFHVVKLANGAIDTARRWAWNQARGGQRVANAAGRGREVKGTESQRLKHTRWALLKDPAKLKNSQRQVLDQLRSERHVLYRAYELKEELRDLYRLKPGQRADAHLDAWLARACRCRIPAMVRLSRTIRRHRTAIIAAVDLGLSNSKLEGLNSKTRLINHRGYGHHSATALIAMIYLCSGGITIKLPTQT
jgi:transposase